jgi:hypothetical protein
MLRSKLRAMLDSSAGLLTRVDIQDSLQGIHFDVAAASSGDIGQIQFGMTSEARNDRLKARLDVALNDLTLRPPPADLAAVVPRRIAIRPAVEGVRTEPLRRLLLDATGPGPDQDAVRAQAIALLNEPGARIGIESLLVEAGPLQLDGDASVRPLPDNKVGFEIHLRARGLDAMITALQGSQQAQQFLPMVYMAKGMARQRGDSLVWDISFADGVFTVNGQPLGGPPGARQPGSRPPGTRPPGMRPPNGPPSASRPPGSAPSAQPLDPSR